MKARDANGKTIDKGDKVAVVHQGITQTGTVKQVEQTHAENPDHMTLVIDFDSKDAGVDRYPAAAVTHVRSASQPKREDIKAGSAQTEEHRTARAEQNPTDEPRTPTTLTPAPAAQPQPVPKRTDNPGPTVDTGQRKSTSDKV